MNSGTHRGRSPSDDGIQRHDVSKAVSQPTSETAAQGQEKPVKTKRPQQDSNLRSRLRRRWITSFEFVHLACLDSMAHLPSRRDHSAHIPDHGYFRRD